MKNYTDIEQSKKLVEILPLESADMYYNQHPLENYYSPIPYIGNYSVIHNQIPCWSASALLEIIRNNGRYELQMYEGGYYFEANGFITESYFNTVDACYEMILKLHETELLQGEIVMKPYTDNEEKLSVLKFIRKETCCGLAEANDALLKLIKVLKEHPLHIMDKPRKLKIEWEE